MVECLSVFVSNPLTYIFSTSFPKGNAMNNWTVHHLPSYIENSLKIGDANWNRLIAAISDVGLYAGLAYSERLDDHMYMAQTLIAPNGSTLLHRHKLRPSGSERWFFTDGNIEDIRAVTTPHGRMGQLECGEHMYQTTRILMAAQAENIHLGPFPYWADEGDPDSLWWENVLQQGANSRAYAYTAASYNFVASIGAAGAYDPLGFTLATINASADMVEYPILYASANTSAFNTSQTYTPDGRTSWGVINETLAGFPEYIPKEDGAWIGRREKSVAWLMTGALTTELGESFPM